EAALEVRAPLKASKAEIERFITAKEHWIQRSIRSSLERLEKKAQFRLAYGKYLTLRGAEYPIVPVDGSEAYWERDRFCFPRGLTPEQIKRRAAQLYRLLARDYLTVRAKELAGKMNVMPAMIKITSAKTRWGSCSARGNVNYSWRLIIAGDQAIDYVIVHELAHLKEMNHSGRFWAIVEAAFPDYREQHRELRLLQRRLEEEGWD
ncbi:MAG: M48 family metallopeptidase, partial [Syntrophomonadaceae bacterium]|nr:M48 family metallopeptidase [Syntrophomonadaceae bacterium]